MSESNAKRFILNLDVPGEIKMCQFRCDADSLDDAIEKAHQKEWLKGATVVSFFETPSSLPDDPEVLKRMLLKSIETLAAFNIRGALEEVGKIAGARYEFEDANPLPAPR